MTKEEFRDYVDFLRSQDAISYDVYSGLIDGIDALEEEPKIVPIAEIKFDDDMLHKIVEEAVKNIEIEPKWIPVSEGLPEPYNDVYLTICANSSYYGFNKNFMKVKCGQYQPQDDKRDWLVDGVSYYFDNVIAWMPYRLPKPYKPHENCDTCKHKDDEWDSEPCDGCCGNHSGFEPQKISYTVEQELNNYTGNIEIIEKKY